MVDVASDEEIESRAPLISSPHEQATDDSEHHQSPATRTPSNDSAKRQRATYLLVMIAGLSGLLFGYDTGIISSTLLSLPTSLGPLTTLSASLITSSTSLFALLAAPLSPLLADSRGRKPAILASCALFALGAAMQAAARDVPAMVAGRGVVGLAVGLASAVVPLYVAEIAPAARRGRLVTVQSLFVTGGQVVAYAVGWALGDRWRVAVGLGAVPAVVQAVLMGWLVESPRFLVAKGREGEARRVLGTLLGEDELEEVMGRVEEEMKEVAAAEGESRWGALVGVRRNRRALWIACMLQGLQQLCGFNVLMYFSATIFAMVGFKSPVSTSLSVAGTNFVFTLFAFRLIDSIGRRRILLLSIPFMAIGLGLCAFCFHHLSVRGPHHEQWSRITDSPGASKLSLSLVVSLILYVAAYASGLGCVPWQQAELFPLKVRSLGSGLATATNWSGNFVVGITFLPMMEALGTTWTFSLYAVVCFVGWWLVWAFYPETAGLELEDIGYLLDEGWTRPSSKLVGQVTNDEDDDDDDSIQ